MSEPRRLPLRAVAAVVATLAVTIAARAGRHPMDSDSVAQQAVLWTWRTDGHGTVYLPPNTWWLKFPIYLAVEALPLSPERRLVLESLILNALGYAALAIGCWLLADRVGRRWHDVALPAMWVVSLGGALGYYMSIMPNFRNIELGIVVLTLAGAARYLDPDRAPSAPDGVPHRRRSALGAAAASIALALLWLDDPYAELAVAVPLAAACLLCWVRWRAPRLVVVAVVIGASSALAAAGRRALGTVGVEIVAPQSVLSLEPAEVGRRAALLWPATADQLGWHTATPAAAAASIAAVSVLAAGAVASIALARRAWRGRRVVPLVLALTWVVIAAETTVKGGVLDVSAGRYLMPGIVLLAAVLGLGAAAVRGRRPGVARAVTVLLATATAANVALTATATPPRSSSYAQHADLVSAITATGVRKGYADYWSVNIHVHATEGRLALTPVFCRDGRLRLWRFVTDSARHDSPAPRTLLLWDASTLGACPVETLGDQLGAPVQQLPVTAPSGRGPAYLLVYDRDLGPLLDG